MKKILPILLLCFCFSATAQTIDDFSTVMPTTDNNMSVVFPAGTLSDYVGGTLQAYISGVPVSASTEIAADGSAGVAVIGTACAYCNPPAPNSILADGGETIHFAILVGGQIIVITDVDPPVTYAANSFQMLSGATLTFTVDGAAVVFGCTDAAYLEFDASANLDNGSCSVLIIEGCTDGTADNFDASANVDDWYCLYTGCMDTSADNYDANANVDGYCQYLGCTDASACNYDTNANEDDASCDGLVGCMDAAYYEFDAIVTCDNGSCVSLIIPGCMDEDAYNYWAIATEDDGSCVPIEFVCLDPCAANYFYDNGYIINDDNGYFMHDEDLCYYISNGYNCDGTLIYEIDSSNFMTIQFPNTEEFVQNSNFQVGDILFAYFAIQYLQNQFLNFSEPASVHAIRLGLYLNENYEWVGYELGACEWCSPEEVEFSNNELIVYGRNVDSIPNGFVQGEEITWVVQRTDGVVYNAFLTYNTAGYDGTYEEGEFVIANSISIGTPFYNGCMDATAPNFNPLAYTDDGSCESSYSIGCMDEDAMNFAGVGANPVFVNANNYGNPFGENQGINLNSGATFSSGIAANIHDQNFCQSQVLGCTNSVMFNYNTLATEDDGSCIDVVIGCIDANAFNYNSSANSDDGSCIPFIEGCTYSGFFNYNSAANTDDSSCVPFVFGCMDVTAYNYNELANTDDGSCIDSGCCCLVEDLTTTCGWSLDFDCLATSNCNVCYDPPCDYPVLGCTDFNAVNYNDQATYDDGTCIIYGCMDATADNYDATATNSAACVFVGCMNTLAFNYDALANTPGDCIDVILGCTDEAAINTTEGANTDDGTCIEEALGCPYTYFLEYNPNYTVADVSLCITIIVEGCMNEDAENFNPEANIDDGTCVVFGCMNSAAENYNPEATLQDDSCILYGCTNETAENYNDQSTVNDGTCIIYGCTLSIFPNYNPEATVDDLSCNPEGIQVYGCTDDNALNYISQANTDNGSCLYQDDDCSISIQEENIPLYLPEGWVLFGYTCLQPLDLSLGFESIVDLVIIVKDSDGNAYLPEWNFNGIGDLIYSRGYQIKTTEEITDFSFCPTLIGAEALSNPQNQVGDLAEGGIVFYVDETGEHGLVAALEDLTEGATNPLGIGEGYQWGCYGVWLSGADGTSIGTGYQNTMDIVNSGCSNDIVGLSAAQAALDVEINGYSDWYLPSIDELVEMYNTIGPGGSEGNIGGLWHNTGAELISYIDECYTISIYAPVCGENGVTYVNDMLAECAGVDYIPGGCIDYNPPNPNYWSSSTHYSVSDYAWLIQQGNSDPQPGNKNQFFGVRVIRSF